MRVVYAFLVLAFLNCSTRVPVKGINAFYQGDFVQSEQIFKAALEKHKDDKDTVLFELALLSASMRTRDVDVAENTANSAMRRMWSLGDTGRGVSSLVSSEAIKVFKGEPFEKAMAAIYLGIIYYNRGELDNARAAFQKSLMAIKQKEPPHQEDFALGFILLSKVLVKLGDSENAQIAFNKATKLMPGSHFSFEDLKKCNVLVLVEMGYPPRKVRSGPGASLVTWVRQRYPERQVAIFLNDHKVETGSDAADLTYQASTKGTTGKDVIQGTKGALREAAGVTAVIAADQAINNKNKTAGWVALGAGLFAIANQSQADVRQWELLPDLISVAPMQIKPGVHRLKLQFSGSGGEVLPRLDQIWYPVNVTDKTDQILLFRSIPEKNRSQS